MTPFVLDPRLAADCMTLGHFALSRLLLMNDATYPWLILVPERPDAREIFDLDAADQLALATETALVARTLKTLCTADKINVAALGNVVSQLHVHVIARFASDPAWPAPVWGRTPPRPYAPDAAESMRARIAAALDAAAADGAVPGRWRPAEPLSERA
ncbi:MAG: HIT domain-containing protein [Rhodospirillales bacterium]|nr:HIT domain-containing protein [Rhodospirillales bacterium]